MQNNSTGILENTVTNPSKKKSVILMPSLLAAPFDHLGAAIRDLENAGVSVFHYDVMDGHFVPNLSGSPHILEDLQPNIHCKFDVHLMVDNPEAVIPWFDLPCVRSISIHVEASKDLPADLESIRSKEKLAGIVINPPTPNEALEPYFELVDQVLVMTVFPGLGGQALIKDTLTKIEYCQHRRDALGLDFAIQVDGGVKADTIRSVFDAGANEIVSGSAIFGHDNPAESFRNMNRIIGNDL